MSSSELTAESSPNTELTEPGDVLSIRMDKRADLALAVAFVLAGALIIYLASQFRIGSFPDPVTPRGLPYFSGGFMILGGIVLIVRRLLTWNDLPGNLVPSEGVDDEPGHEASATRAFAIVGLAFLWVALVRQVGYLILTPPIILGHLLLLNVRSPAKLIAFPLGVTFVIWAVFSQILKIQLPLGPLEHLFRAWGLIP